MKKVAEKLAILKMTPAERSHYYYQKKIYSDKDQLQTAYAKEKTIEIVKDLLAQGLDNVTIATATGSSFAEIKKIKL